MQAQSHISGSRYCYVHSRVLSSFSRAYRPGSSWMAGACILIALVTQKTPSCHSYMFRKSHFDVFLILNTYQCIVNFM